MFKKGQSKITVTQDQLDSDADNVKCPECETRLFLKYDTSADPDGDKHCRCRHCGAQVGVKIVETAKKTVEQPKLAIKHKAAKK
jgi:DNA-directed RNA polymerase subunit RPC12/RpoP